jgi:DNA-binding GntR family transcriptional regulator
MAFSRPPTAQEAVLVELRRVIATGEIAPGAPIRQDALAEQLGVSRVPVREALKILEGEGQVTYEAHRGYSVTQLSAADLAEAYRLREILEAEAIRQAMKRMTPADLDRVVASGKSVHLATRSGDMTAITAANREFHFALFEVCAQPRLIRLIRQLWDATEVYRGVYFQTVANRRQTLRDHDAMEAALRGHDIRAVIKILDEHRRTAIERLELS